MRRPRQPPRWGRGNHCHASASPVYHNAPLAHAICPMYLTFVSFPCTSQQHRFSSIANERGGRVTRCSSLKCQLTKCLCTPFVPMCPPDPDPAPSGGTARTAEQAVQGANQGAGHSENYERAAQASPGVLSPTGRHGSGECSPSTVHAHVCETELGVLFVSTVQCVMGSREQRHASGVVGCCGFRVALDVL